MKYLFDNNISPKFARMLQMLDVEAFALRDVMEPNTPDVEIIEWVENQKGDWVFVTGDRRTKTRPLEAAVFKETKVTVIYLAPFWNKRTFWDQAAWLVARWQNIDGFCAGAERGVCAEIKQNGRANPISF